MTDQIISVILPVLASRGGPGSVVLLLQLLLQAPEVVHAIPGQDPVGEGGVRANSGQPSLCRQAAILAKAAARF